jgi:hypothetical protein
MVGNQNVQVNLEQKVGGSGILAKLGNTIKQYAAIAVVGAALAIGGAGCGELSECCKEKDCSYGCTDHYDDTCACDPYSPPDPGSKYMTQEFGLSLENDVFENDATTYD